MSPLTKPTPGPPGSQLAIEGDDVHVVTPEGARKSMPIGALVKALRGSENSGSGMVLPDGVKMAFSRGRSVIWVHQSPPSVRRLKWIADDSPAPYGESARYREVTIALPYVIVLAIFLPGPGGKAILSDHNEAFFCNAPLTTSDEELCYPALLNCSKFDPQEGRPLSWICTQYLRREFDREPDDNKRFQLSLKGLLACLFETGFNYSSEHHELTSWFSESRSADKRIASIDAWEKATAADRLFPLEVPWLKSGLTLHEIVERTFRIHPAREVVPKTAAGLAGFIMNHADNSVVDDHCPPTPNPELPF
jgi:hypothetical protein